MQNLKHIENVDRLILFYYEHLILDKQIDSDAINKIITDTWTNGNLIEMIEARYTDRLFIVNQKYPEIVLSEKDHPEYIESLKKWLYDQSNDHNKRLLTDYDIREKNTSNTCNCTITCKNYCNLI